MSGVCEDVHLGRSLEAVPSGSLQYVLPPGKERQKEKAIAVISAKKDRTRRRWASYLVILELFLDARFTD